MLGFVEKCVAFRIDLFVAGYVQFLVKLYDAVDQHCTIHMGLESTTVFSRCALRAHKITYYIGALHHLLLYMHLEHLPAPGNTWVCRVHPETHVFAGTRLVTHADMEYVSMNVWR